MGTPGYIEPEFADTGKNCRESDVYSFGIVLLEMVTGRGPLSQPRARVWELYAQDRVLDAVSPTLRSELNDQQMERVLVVGLWCTQTARSERPSIAQAMGVLEHTDAQLPVLSSCHGQLAATLGSLGESLGQRSMASPILRELALVPSQIYTNTAPVATTTEPAYSSAMITPEALSTAHPSSTSTTCSYTTCSVSAPATTSLGT
ncbi:hypothetical protein BAE44_0020978 [Dichanthelium oligosanthes]|uniref:Protein kinase domain-containing protein n=1 Tax=Dichanthelium oligosanthes TaxID=888268 RepID=A0A1E5UYK3_9POAL|nr:hypothetical protein BAE44_0020978 [Dichanthelium oligosanthes]